MQLDRSVWGSPGGALDTFLKNGAEFKVDIDALEARFARPDAGRRAPTADGTDGPPGLISSRSRRVALLDPKRSTKLGIVMKKIEAALGAKEVAEAIITVDESFMRQETLRMVLGILPTAEEVALLRAYDGDVELLDKPERLLLSLAAIPRLEGRLTPR